MKTRKILFAAIFALALGTSYVSNARAAFSDNIGSYLDDFTDECSTGGLDQGGAACSTTGLGAQCTITVPGIGTYPAYVHVRNGNPGQDCVQPLYLAH